MRFPDDRDGIAKALADRGIGTLIYYPVPIHKQSYLKELLPAAGALELPVTEQLASEVLSIPVRPNLTDAEIDEVIDAIRTVADPVASTAGQS
jgi:dTDP-4-amino-4,6-dideoxygalactose transaminase